MAGYDQVNVQTALNAWLSEPGRTHRLVGLTDYHHSDFGLADMMQQSEGWDGPDIGNVELAGPCDLILGR